MDYYCIFCNSRLKGNQRKFCSNSCKCRYFYKQHPDRCNKWRRPKVNNNCVMCGRECGRKKYCSNKCKPIKINEPIYWKEIERINVRCKICEDTIFIPHVHHINGNHHDNKRENLLVVCPSCHIKIHHKKKKQRRSEKEIEKRLEPYRQLLENRGKQ